MKLLFQSNLNLSKEGINDLISSYREWVSLHFLLDEQKFKKDMAMRDMYKDVMTTSPKLIVNKDGTLAVSGLSSFIKN